MRNISDGIVPFRKFDRRLKILRASNFPMVFDGIEPNRPIPGRWIAVTCVRLLLQVIPTQEVQIETLKFQLRLLVCGTVEAK